MWSRSFQRPCARLCKASRPHLLRNISSGRRLLDQRPTFRKDGTHHEHIARRSTGICTSSARGLSHQATGNQSVSVTDSQVDGTKAQTSGESRFGLQTGVPASTSQYNDQGFCVNSSGPDSPTDFTFSDRSQAKLGLVSVKLSVLAPDSPSQSLDSHDQKIDFFRRLDQACQETTLHGLGCLAQAIRAVGTALPYGVNPAVILSANTTATTPASLVVARIEASQQCAIEIGPWATKATDKRRRFENLQVSIRLQDRRHESDQLSAKSHTLGEDLRYLHETATMVVERVTGALEFESIHEMLDSVAQSVLRIVQPRTSSLETSVVTVKDSQSGTCGRASWAISGQGSGPNVDRLTRKIDFAVVKDYLHISLADSLRDDGSDAGSKVQKAPLLADTTSEPAGGLTLSSPITIGGVDFRRCHFAKIRSRAFQTQFDAGVLSLSLYWPADRRKAPDGLTKAEILRMTENAVENASNNGVLGLWQVTETLQTSLPHTPKVSLVFSVPMPLKKDIPDLGRQQAKVIYNGDQDELRFVLPCFTIETSRLQSTAEDGLTVVAIRLIVRGSPIVSAADTAALSEWCRELLRETSGLISSVPKRGPTSSVLELAAEFATAVLDAPTLLGGRFHARNVEVAAEVREGATADEGYQATTSVWRSQQAVVALGSNVGSRVENIESALRAIDADPDMQVCATSALYETRPMYVEGQETFINGVCKITTELRPTELLDRLQSIEKKLGRVKTIDKGPRNIDLDIASVGMMVLKTERLTVPHPLMLEREFVLRPYCDVHSGRHPITRQLMTGHLRQLGPGEPSMFPFTPLAPGCEVVRSLDPVRPTHVMSILNVTPDSFSDGGDNQPTRLDALRDTIAAHIKAGATIIDIGGQSSRPNALDITAEEEIARIVPAIEILKSMPEAKHISISVDTYRAAVAEAAINAGAHIINDISAGQLDPDMLSTVARLGCTFVMMHMRGTPATMQQSENTVYEHGLIDTIAVELISRLQAASEAGIRRWRIILDPGLGFAKTAEQNAELLGRFGELRNHPRLKNFPWLVGSSRKGFIGKFTGAEDPKDRLEGTAATVTAAVAGGAEIVRVHDVKEMVRVVKMADAMYRVRPSQAVKAKVGDVEEAKDEESEVEAGMETEGEEEEDEEGEDQRR